jgi:hypothetical protein
MLKVGNSNIKGGNNSLLSQVFQVIVVTAVCGSFIIHMWTCCVFDRDVMQYDKRRPFASYSRVSVLVSRLRFQKVVEGRP